MKGTVKVTRRDTGLNRFKQRIARLAASPKAITVGVHSDADGSYEGGQSVVDIATAHEFGLGVPQRSFIRAWADEEKDKSEAMIARAGAAIARGTISEEQALEQLGAYFVGRIRARIRAGVPPPNADSTIERKGSSTPLVDTGALSAAIDFKVE